MPQGGGVMSRWSWIAASLVGAVPALVVAAWVDQRLVALQRAQGRDFSPPGPYTAAMSVAIVAIVVAILALAVAAWRSRSAVVEVAYAIVGGFVAFLPAIAWNLATQINDVPPVLPGPLATAISNLYLPNPGPLSAPEFVGAGMLVAGLAVTARSAADRRRKSPAPTADGAPGLTPAR
jgi:hypothetical protein